MDTNQPKIDVEFAGEFGYELAGVLPYAYFLHLNGRLGTTRAAHDTAGLYYFSKDHHEVFETRQDVGLDKFPIKRLHVPSVDASQWVPPPYKDVYRNDTLVFKKPLCVISNKYAIEWRGPPVNFLSKEVLVELCKRLRPNYTIVYNRPDGHHVLDRGEMEDRQPHLDEKPAVVEAGAILLEDLWSYHPQYTTFNALQLALYANCDKFISVQGGGCILCSYFAKTNDIFAVKGGEFGNGFNWFNQLGGGELRVHTNYNTLLETAS